MSKVRPIPEGYHTVTPYLFVKGASQAIEFYKKAFNATANMYMNDEGKVFHAELTIGNSKLMLADEFPEMNVKGPQSYGGSPVMMHLYVEDVDHFFNQAVNAGAKVIRPVANQFYGDRSGTIVDPFGHMWTLSTHVEDISETEMAKRSEEAMKQKQCS